MGDEVRQEHFQQRDFAAFESHLREETDLVAKWLESGKFASTGGIGGFELEAWLVDHKGRPAPLNEEFLRLLDSPLAVPELARYNIELNTSPRFLRDDALACFQGDLEALWEQCDSVGRTLDVAPIMIGILPTIRESDLSLESMSDRLRYRALNEQVLRLRGGTPLHLKVDGVNPLETFHRDVMIEATTTSFQLHLQVDAKNAAQYHNAACILSAPMVASCSNSPYLFGHDLWAESRIPVFEQAVAVSPSGNGSHRNRVTFGDQYVHESMLECFVDNLHQYQILLPVLSDEPASRLPHLRLHNGTIWRWNRPLIGFGEDGVPHLRIEHRVIPSGPSIPDLIANAALFYGLARFYGEQQPPAESLLPFEKVRENFYAAARHGLGTEITWLGGRARTIRALMLEELIPQAHEGLIALGIRAADRERYLGIIESRIETGRTGSVWQRKFVERHGPDWEGLVLSYLQHQRSGKPVHQWD